MNKTVKLPDPQVDLDFPLMKALEKRRTKRKWCEKDFSDQELSNLLWAACGETKKATKRAKSKRTAPSACNSQEIRVYIALAKGLYLYDEKNHELQPILSDDIRENIGTQKMMKSAPAGLIYVADFSRFKTFIFSADERKWMTSAIDTGFISQNVYLYAAAANYNTAVLSLVNRDKLHEVMGLNEHEHIVYTQVIGKVE